MMAKDNGRKTDCREITKTVDSKFTTCKQTKNQKSLI